MQMLNVKLDDQVGFIRKTLTLSKHGDIIANFIRQKREK